MFVFLYFHFASSALRLRKMTFSVDSNHYVVDDVHHVGTRIFNNGNDKLHIMTYVSGEYAFIYS